jgi:sortase A
MISSSSRVSLRRSAPRMLPLAIAIVALTLSACGNSGSSASVKASSSVASTTTTATTAATTTTAAPTTTTTVAPTTTTTEAPTTTTTEAPTTTTVAPVIIPRAVPENQADKNFIEIPKIGLTQPILEGIELSVLDNGIGHWPGTAMPGQKGNVVLAGHRVSHTRPFRNIDQLGDGDEVFMTINGAKFRYVVSGHEIVTPDQVRIVDQTPDATATLFACHPPGSTEFRWVTYLKYTP